MALWEYWEGKANRGNNALDSTRLNDRLFSFLESVTWLPRTIWGGLMILISSVLVGVAFAGESLAQSASLHRLGGAVTLLMLSFVLFGWTFYKEWDLEFSGSSDQQTTNTFSWVMGLVVVIASIGVLSWRAQNRNDMTRQVFTTSNRFTTPEAVTASESAPTAPSADSRPTSSGSGEDQSDIQSTSSNQSPEVSLPANTAEILAHTDSPHDGSSLQQSTTITALNSDQGVGANPYLSEQRTGTPGNEAAADSYVPSSANAGYETYRNAKFGFTIDFPKSFVHTARPTNNGDGIVLASRDGRALFIAIGGPNSGKSVSQWYDAAIENGHGKLGYRVMGGTWFVATWTQGKNLEYLKIFVDRDSENSFTLIYPADEEAVYADVVTRIEKSFRPSNVSQPR